MGYVHTGCFAPASIEYVMVRIGRLATVGEWLPITLAWLLELLFGEDNGCGNEDINERPVFAGMACFLG
jgi:hypothetical protein